MEWLKTNKNQIFLHLASITVLGAAFCAYEKFQADCCRQCCCCCGCKSCNKGSSCDKGCKSNCCGQQGKKSIYERLGGQPGMQKAIIKFYDKMLVDDRVKHFFKSIDMNHQIQQQIDFLTAAFGGPNKYKGRNLKDVHKHMKINNLQYDATVQNLCDTFKEMGADQETLKEIVAITETVRDDCVTVKN